MDIPQPIRKQIVPLDLPGNMEPGSAFRAPFLAPCIVLEPVAPYGRRTENKPEAPFQSIGVQSIVPGWEKWKTRYASWGK